MHTLLVPYMYLHIILRPIHYVLQVNQLERLPPPPSSKPHLLPDFKVVGIIGKVSHTHSHNTLKLHTCTVHVNTCTCTSTCTLYILLWYVYVDISDYLSPCAGDLGGESPHRSKVHLQSTLQVPSGHGSCWQGKVKGHHQQDPSKQTSILTTITSHTVPVCLTTCTKHTCQKYIVCPVLSCLMLAV